MVLKPSNFRGNFRGKCGPKSQKRFSLKKCQEAHQFDQQNVLNVKMYMVGTKNYCFFMGQKW